MDINTSRRPPSPTAAERARSMATRGRAVILPAIESAARVNPVLHHVHPDGAVSALLSRRHPLVGLALHGAGGELAAMIEVADTAPVALREPVRGLLWISGLLSVLPETAARAVAVNIAESRPDPRLLDVGHDMVVLRLRVASLVLADAESSGPLEVAEFASATPDPFCRFEAGWLRHLEGAHRNVVDMLARHLPEKIRGGRVRPLGLDRLGLRLRIEDDNGDHDVRLAFARPVRDVTELSAELRRLVGCPFLARQI
ncbi:MULTISPECIES: DUF2470 domain-containing protein [Actinoalloteichus]|uniref:DUF2470 domain-containing protein n=1 Tax=Actinoalloteichus fjordicus TaxID=1612552 RepID=A0AAC9L8A7_9PSEU|nr:MULTISPECIES: DUF2470 domain-containing protein [Actinoalloteichus]APU12204.1 hypothetical protein UA74_00525 [Actinoalloteichus fjordicus]APU18156.1 hypothetical protein UA75_00525 [Actinoalloteichus sp. GBA129-24]